MNGGTGNESLLRLCDDGGRNVSVKLNDVPRVLVLADESFVAGDANGSATKNTTIVSRLPDGRLRRMLGEWLLSKLNPPFGDSPSVRVRTSS
jgi:hypothetical protein